MWQKHVLEKKTKEIDQRKELDRRAERRERPSKCALDITDASAAGRQPRSDGGGADLSGVDFKRDASCCWQRKLCDTESRDTQRWGHAGLCLLRGIS